MSTRHIPEQFEMKCDVCGVVAVSTSLRGMPTYWAQLSLKRDAYDYQGCAVADGTRRWDLCGKCQALVEKLVDAERQKVIEAARKDVTNE